MGCTFGQRVRFLRKQKNWLVADFLKKLDKAGCKVTNGYISQIELYNKIPSPKMVYLMGKTLCCNRNKINELLVLAKQGKLDNFRATVFKRYNFYIK